jgi:diguanylate cyclase (GGDEF)-like protein
MATYGSGDERDEAVPGAAPRATARVWSADELAPLVAGRLIRLTSGTGLEMTPDTALLAASDGIVPHSSAQSIEAVHPEDTHLVMELISDMTSAPGVLFELRVRSSIDGSWRWVDIRCLNLSHQPEAGYSLTALGYGDLVEQVAEVPRTMSGGDHNSIDWVVGHLSSTANFLHAEGKVEHIFRRSALELIGRRLSEFLHWEAAADGLALWSSLTAAGFGATRSSRRCLQRPDGTELWCELTYLNRLEPDGDGDVLLLICDITDRRAEEAEARLLAEEVPLGIARCEADGQVTFHNTRWTEMFAGATVPHRVQDLAHLDDRGAVDLALASLSAGEMDVRTEVRDGPGARMLGLRLRRVPGDEGSPLRIVASVDDITATIRWRNEARKDALTGLPNRAALEERLDADLAGDTESMAVVFLDLDDFKAVNDRHGHEAGDIVLRAVANRLRAVVRPDDLVSRFGGDEFVMVLTRVAPVDLDAVVARVRVGVESGGPIPLVDGLWVPAVSIGAVLAEPGEARASVLNRADQSMYAAKRAARASADRG